MSKLISSMIASLDGYVADESSRFDWTEPDESVHSFINDLERSVGTYLYGRRILMPNALVAALSRKAQERT